mgnify:CR=1 FL=1
MRFRSTSRTRLRVLSAVPRDLMSVLVQAEEKRKES